MAKSLRQKEINFLAVLEGRKAKKKRGLSFFLIPAVFVLVIVAGGGLFAFFTLETIQTEDKTTEIRTYLNSAAVTRQLADVQRLKSESESMQTQADQAVQPMENLASYPDLTSAEYSRLLEMAGANINLSTMAFDRTTGLLIFAASSDYVLSIPTFVGQLRNSGLFSDVAYTGYAGGSASRQISSVTSRGTTSDLASTTALSAPTYQFSIECSVRPIDRTQPTPPEGEVVTEATPETASSAATEAGGE